MKSNSLTNQDKFLLFTDELKKQIKNGVQFNEANYENIKMLLSENTLSFSNLLAIENWTNDYEGVFYSEQHKNSEYYLEKVRTELILSAIINYFNNQKEISQEELRLASNLITFKLLKKKLFIYIAEHPDTTFSQELILFNMISEYRYNSAITVNNPTQARNTLPRKNISTTCKSMAVKFSSDHNVGSIVHIPEKPKAVLIWVYGGLNLKESVECFDLNTLTVLDKQLLDRDIAIVKVITGEQAKLLQDEQTMMSNDTHEMVNQNIHKLIEFLKNPSENFREELKLLQNLPISTIGHSFGGRTAVRFMQLNPEDINGAIAINACLDFDILKKHETVSYLENKYHLRWNEKSDQAAQWLSPALNANIQKLTKPVFIIHNINDDNAIIDNVIAFIKKAEEAKKTCYYQFYCTNDPNTLSFSKNHAIPSEDDSVFPSIVDNIEAFALGQPPRESDLDFKQCSLLTGITTPEASIKKITKSYSFWNKEHIDKDFNTHQQNINVVENAINFVTSHLSVHSSKPIEILTTYFSLLIDEGIGNLPKELVAFLQDEVKNYLIRSFKNPSLPERTIEKFVQLIPKHESLTISMLQSITQTINKPSYTIDKLTLLTKLYILLPYKIPTNEPFKFIKPPG